MRILILVALLAGIALAANQPPEKKETGPDQKGKPKITIGKDTTRVTEPVDKDGYIDYAKALNDKLRDGVTADNNANVLLWQAMGPHPEGVNAVKVPAEFFKLLGVDAPPEKGDYFVSFQTFMNIVDPTGKAEERDELFERIRDRHWTSKQHPHAAAWLKANDKALALVIEASKRTHYYSPVINSPTADNKPSPIFGALLPGVQKNREFVHALTARAMLHTGENHYDDAWDDLLACHRLGRVLARGGTLIEHLVGIFMDDLANYADLAMLDYAKMDGEKVLKCLQDLQKLPPLPSVADKVDLMERYSYLDCVGLLDRHGIGFLEQIAGGAKKPPDPKLKQLSVAINWDPALRSANKLYDRLAAAMRVKERPAREKEIAQIINELKEMRAKLPLDQDLAKALGGGAADPDTIGKKFGDVLLGLMVPAVQKVQQADDRAEQNQRNLHVAFALVAFRRDNSNYPKKLDELVPKYLAAIPNDLFTGKPLIYRPSDTGFLLYSFGVNEQDDQGRNWDDDPAGDDLRVRMPLPPLKKG